MADNKFYGNQKVFTDSDFENITIVDPNKIVNEDGTVEERLVNHENLMMYANLEARVIPRTKLAAGTSYSNSIKTVGVGQLDVNFLKGKQNKDLKVETNNANLNNANKSGKNPTYMDTSWTDQFLFAERKTAQEIDTQLLGITRISIKMNSAYVPQVTIEMTDIQGRVLFEHGDQSPYSVFFQMPYPVFILTVKGYYGKAIKLELMLKDFNARFDPSDGSYKITTNYISRSHALLNDTLLDYLYATPHMYSKRYEENSKNTNTTVSASNSTVPVDFIETTKGLEKLKETYSLYKQKGLISDDFPEITLNQMIMKLEYFNKVVMESYQKEDMSVLSDIVDYENLINEYRASIFPDILNNWFNLYIDGSFLLVFNDENASLGYRFSGKIDTLQKKENAFSELEAIIDDYNQRLESNRTFGVGGKYTIDKKTKSGSEIKVDIKKSDFIKRIYDYEDIDFEKTYSSTKGSTPTETQVQTFKADLIARLEAESIIFDENFQQVDNSAQKNTFIIFGNKNSDTNFSDNSFLGKIAKIETKFKALKEDIEKELSQALAKKIQSSDIGLGFIPTINNVLAVICAGADAFYKLMDDVHTNAWDVRNEPIRLKSIIPPSKINTSTDGKVPLETFSEVTTTEEGTDKVILKDTTSVYPWPQYFEIVKDKDDKEVAEIKYPGLPSVIGNTQGWNYKIWPEIQFVEEYLKGSLEKEKPEVMPFSENQLQNTPYVFPNAIEFPFQNIPYSSGDRLSLMYEIWERTYLAANYTKLAKNNGFKRTIYTILGDFEVKNVEESIKDDQSLKEILKTFNFSYSTFNRFLRSGSSNGQGRLWNQKIRDYFTNPAIASLVENDFGIYSIDSLNTNSTYVDGVDASLNNLDSYLEGTESNTVSYLDVFPFNNLQWLKTNLSNGNKVNSVENANSTTKILKFDINKKTFTTFNQSNDNNDSKTYLTYLDFPENVPQNPNQLSAVVVSPNTNISGNFKTLEQAKDYYLNRTFNIQYLTESPLNYGDNYNTGTNNLVATQTTSLLNTPYFINSLLKSVENKKANTDNPNVTLGYMYLNSLPLSTLSEKYLTKQTQTDGKSSYINLDYIFAGLSKFSAIHKMTYLWLLKYGSIWHRYKTYQNTSVDILDDVWKDFDFIDGYDPITQDFTKQYTIQNYTGGTLNYKTESLNSVTLGLTTNEELIINNGLYPKVIDSIYYFFTGKDVFTNYTQSEWDFAHDYLGLKVGISDRENIQSYDISTPNRSLDYRSWYQYFDIGVEEDFTFDVTDKVLVVPSSGYLKFNQSKLECFNVNNQITQPIQANQSVQNGNVRSFWSAPNYGYFNNEWIKKPNVNEYIKVIDNTKEQQFAFNIENRNSSTSYKSIEEIFAIFTPEILDKFEEHFLNFCKDNGTYGDIIINPTIENQSSYLGSETYKYEWNIEEVMKSLFISDKPTDLSGTDSIEDVEKIANKQATNFISKNTNKLKNEKVVLKIGNPGNFNRRVFDSFSRNDSFTPVNPIVFGNYVTNTLPTSNGTITLSGSKSLNPNAWNAMYLYVGDYVEDGLKYSDTGSTLTDFFVDMNVEFTEDNVINLSKIIKIYGSQKYNNPSLTPTEFRTNYEAFLNSQLELQNNMLNHMFLSFNKNLPEIKVTESNDIVSKLDGDDIKNELWVTFKNFNDRWVAGQDFKERTLFEEFLFLDKANRPIGNDVIINVEDLRLYLRNANADSSLFSLIGMILKNNNFVFMPVPSYANFYGRNQRTKTSQPDPKTSDIANDTFGTFLEVDTYGSEPKFLAIYIGKTSEVLNTGKDNTNFLYKDDSFNITKPSPNPLVASENTDNVSDRNKVVGFNVDFGVRNQGIFKSISLDMSQRKNIAPTFQILANLGGMADGRKTSQMSSNLYEFYRNGSYNCVVTSMGNAMIQPTMYFNLRYVPMFYGAYLIINVSHDITPRDFTTTFEGVRIPVFSIPKPDSLVASVNREIVQSYKNQIRRINNAVGPNVGVETNRVDSITNSSVKNSDKKQSTEDKCSSKASKPVQYVSLERQSISYKDLKTLIENNFNEPTTIYTKNVKKYAFAIAFVESGEGDKVNTLNYNLYNFKNDNSKAKIPINYSSQVCVKEGEYYTPYIAFSDFNESITFMKRYVYTYDTLITSFLNNPTINGDLAKAFTYIWYYTLRYSNKSTNITQTGLEDDRIITTIDSELSDNKKGKTLFDNAYETIKVWINKWDTL